MTAKDYLERVVSKISPGDLKGVVSNIHFDFGKEKYTIELNNGDATFKEGLVGDPEVNFRSTPENFLKLASGNLNPMMAMMTGKVKVSNATAMMKYAKMLGLMK